MQKKIYIAVLLALLWSCAGSGLMEGRLQAQKQAFGHVVFHYKSNLSGNRGTISTVLPDGEEYSREIRDNNLHDRRERGGPHVLSAVGPVLEHLGAVRTSVE